MKSSSLATRVDHITKKHFVETARSLGMTVCEYLAYYLTESLEDQKKIALLQQEKETLEQKLLQYQQISGAENVVTKSNNQKKVEAIMEKNDSLLETFFHQNKHKVGKDELKQAGFNFFFSTSCINRENSNLIHCLYTYGYSLDNAEVTIYKLKDI